MSVWYSVVLKIVPYSKAKGHESGEKLQEGIAFKQFRQNFFLQCGTVRNFKETNTQQDKKRYMKSNSRKLP